KLLLKRRRDRRRHRLGAGAGQRGAHLNGGEVDRRQIRHRQEPVRHEPERDQTQHDERRHDGPLDEQLGDVHGFTLLLLSLATTRLPATRRNCPVATTTSPGSMPFARTDSFSFAKATVTGFTSTVLSGFTRKTYVPCCPVWTACESTTMASFTVVSV